MKNEDRLERALEGLLSDEEWRTLQADIIHDEELRSTWVERAWLDANLRANRESLKELLEEPAPISRRPWRASVWAASAAACLTFLAFVGILGRDVLFHRPVAVLTQADNCKWAGSDLPTAVNSKLGAGILSLVEGIATLEFNNGATVTIEAPTKLEIRDAMHCRLIEGSVVAHVPDPAHGFTIDTRDMKVVDLGTRFGLTTGASGHSQVHVFEGEVEVGATTGGTMKRLTQGKGLNIDSGSTPVDQEPNRAQPMTDSGGWTTIPTSFGSGKDAYSRRGDGGAPMGTEPVIMVKHTELEASRKNERRAFVTFDVSKIATSGVKEAQLRLDPVPSGFGFSALVPDSRFAVYGITDESCDTWDERALRWVSSPACTDAGPTPGQARKLSEFWIPRGGGGTVTVRGDAIGEFLRQDTNGLVSFMIVRETGESDPSGLVHAFASKEHPSAQPPTLRVK